MKPTIQSEANKEIKALGNMLYATDHDDTKRLVAIAKRVNEIAGVSDKIEEAKLVVEELADLASASAVGWKDNLLIEQIKTKFLASLAGTGEKKPHHFTIGDIVTCRTDEGEWTITDLSEVNGNPYASIKQDGKHWSTPVSQISLIYPQHPEQPTQGEGFTEAEVRGWMERNPFWQGGYVSASVAIEDAASIYALRNGTGITPTPEAEGGEI